MLPSLSHDDGAFKGACICMQAGMWQHWRLWKGCCNERQTEHQSSQLCAHTVRTSRSFLGSHLRIRLYLSCNSLLTGIAGAEVAQEAITAQGN